MVPEVIYAFTFKSEHSFDAIMRTYKNREDAEYWHTQYSNYYELNKPVYEVSPIREYELK